MATFTDQLGRSIILPKVPQRIVSLVPSQTELLFDLGLEKEVVGITKFCVHPESMFRSKPRVGGTKTVNFERIAALQPDLIIGNKEENEQSQIQRLMEQYNVWMSDIETVPAALDMIQAVGKITGKATEAQALTKKITTAFANMPVSSSQPPLKVAYFIWKDPYMVAGDETFIHHIIERCGWKNAIALPRYPEVTPENLQKMALDIIMLSSEPYPFKTKHLQEFQELFPSSKVLVVDGEYFSWYGSRLQYAPSYFAQIIEQIQTGNFSSE